MALAPPLSLRPRCDACHEVLGAYEPVMWELSDSVAVTTPLLDPEISSPRRRGFVYHRHCYEADAGTPPAADGATG